MNQLFWQSVSNIQSKSYQCGYCGQPIASEKGYHAKWQNGSTSVARIHICHYCSRPTFFEDDGTQYPGTVFGEAVDGISDQSVSRIYDEARKAFSASAYTASVLCCRKLLMHVAVSKGAEAGKNFAFYVEFLGSHHYVPPDAAPWVDHIRSKGNEANHEVVMASKEDAEELISFSEMLLKVIFEFPAAVKKRVPKKA